MVNVDASVFIQVGNFLVLVWILNIILFRPIRNALDARQSKIDGLEKSIKNFLDELKDKHKKYNDGIDQARSKGIEQRDKIANAAQENEKEILREINQKLQVELDAIRKKISSQVADARAELTQEMKNFANVIGEKILGRALA